MYIIGFDIAVKSLAVSIIEFNNNWDHDLAMLKQHFFTDILDKTIIQTCQKILIFLDKLEDLLNNLIKLIFIDVVDLIPNQKVKNTTPIERALKLKEYLYKLDNDHKHILTDNCKILLEYQMGPNDKSRTIFSQILYHYSDISVTKNIEIVGPSLKNKININKNTSFGDFYKKYTKTYDANKKHSICNMLQWLKNNNMEHMIKNIQKKNLDDVADAFNMSLAWLFIKSNCI